MIKDLDRLLESVELSVQSDNFVKITLSKPIRKSQELTNVYIRPITLKGAYTLQFLYRYKTKDQVKNYSVKDSLVELQKLLSENFNVATFFSLINDISVLISKKKKVTYRVSKPTFKEKLPDNHDKVKVKRAQHGSYLFYLGITDKEGNVIPKMADKYRQINKYLEIIEAQLKSVHLQKKIQIVDMGSGKGYLTFALYDYLVNTKGYAVVVTGIELRESLVNYCNDIAVKCGFDHLHFVAQSIQEYDADKMDILIALHACDTATDDAIFKGLMAKAELIICAPCCHKQIRKQVKGKEQESPILKYGIFKERQLEMVTDTIRALLLEKNNYNTKVFEFISNEHTRKNVMLIGAKSSKSTNVEEIQGKIQGIKDMYCIDEHYLEKLLD